MHATRAPGPPDAPSSHPRFEVRRADGSLRRRRVIRPKPATLKVDKRAPPGVECYKLTAPDEGMKGTLTRVPESEGVHPHGPPSPPRLARTRARDTRTNVASAHFRHGPKCAGRRRGAHEDSATRRGKKGGSLDGAGRQVVPPARAACDGSTQVTPLAHELS